MAYINTSALRKQGYEVSDSGGRITVSKDGVVVSSVESARTNTVTARGSGVSITEKPIYSSEDKGFIQQTTITTPSIQKADSGFRPEFLRRQKVEVIKNRERVLPPSVLTVSKEPRTFREKVTRFIETGKIKQIRGEKDFQSNPLTLVGAGAVELVSSIPENPKLIVYAIPYAGTGLFTYETIKSKGENIKDIAEAFKTEPERTLGQTLAFAGISRGVESGLKNIKVQNINILIKDVKFSKPIFKTPTKEVLTIDSKGIVKSNQIQGLNLISKQTTRTFVVKSKPSLFKDISELNRGLDRQIVEKGQSFKSLDSLYREALKGTPKRTFVVKSKPSLFKDISELLKDIPEFRREKANVYGKFQEIKDKKNIKILHYDLLGEKPYLQYRKGREIVTAYQPKFISKNIRELRLRELKIQAKKIGIPQDVKIPSTIFRIDYSKPLFEVIKKSEPIFKISEIKRQSKYVLKEGKRFKEVERRDSRGLIQLQLVEVKTRLRKPRLKQIMKTQQKQKYSFKPQTLKDYSRIISQSRFKPLLTVSKKERAFKKSLSKVQSFKVISKQIPRTTTITLSKIKSRKAIFKSLVFPKSKSLFKGVQKAFKILPSTLLKSSTKQKLRTKLSLKRPKLRIISKLKKNKVFVRKVKRILASVPKVYRPSFTAVMLNIVASKRPSRLTGVEIRPIIRRLVKKKKNSLRRRRR